MYGEQDNKWSLIQILNPLPTQKNTYFGASLMLHGDRLVVSAAGVHSVYVYNFNSHLQHWSTDDVITKDWFAEHYCMRVAVSGDVIAVTTQNIGLSFVYVRGRAGGWEERALLRATSEPRSANRGMSVRVKKNFVFTGRYVINGAVYVHDISKAFP